MGTTHEGFCFILCILFIDVKRAAIVLDLLSYDSLGARLHLCFNFTRRAGPDRTISRRGQPHHRSRQDRRRRLAQNQLSVRPHRQPPQRFGGPGAGHRLGHRHHAQRRLGQHPPHRRQSAALGARAGKRGVGGTGGVSPGDVGIRRQYRYATRGPHRGSDSREQLRGNGKTGPRANRRQDRVVQRTLCRLRPHRGLSHHGRGARRQAGRGGDAAAFGWPHQFADAAHGHYGLRRRNN